MSDFTKGLIFVVSLWFLVNGSVIVWTFFVKGSVTVDVLWLVLAPVAGGGFYFCGYQIGRLEILQPRERPRENPLGRKAG